MTRTTYLAMLLLKPAHLLLTSELIKERSNEIQAVCAGIFGACCCHG